MTAPGHYEGDLEYVREVVEKAGEKRYPPGIFYLWAVIVLVGDILLDIDGQVGGTFWMIAAPAGFLASGYLGYRWNMNRGQHSRSESRAHVLHWLSLLVAIFMSIPLVTRGILQPEGMGALILLLLALGYFTAGLYQARPLLWVGLLLAAGYFAVLFIEGPVWSIVGAVTAVALAMTGWVEGRRGRV